LFDTLRKAISNKIALLQGSSLKARSARGAMVLGVGTIIERGLRLVRNMILARLVAPSEFGTVAVVFATLEALEAFADVGVRQSVIHSRRGEDAEYLNAAWWFQVLRGLALFAVGFIAAPWIGSFYDNPNLPPLMRVAIVAIIFYGFVSPGIYILEKNIQFGKYVIFAQGSGLLGTLVTLGIAFSGNRNAWALVAGYVAEAAFRCLLSFIICPFLPNLKISREYLGDILTYASKMFGVPLLVMIAFQLDILALGKIVSPEQVGMYWLALQLSLQMNMIFSRVIYPILLPAFAEKQDNKRSIGNAVIKITTYTAVIGAPTITFLIVCAYPILSIIYGKQYGKVAVPFSLLCIYALVRIQGSILSQIYFAVGKPNLQRRFVILRLLILICLIYPGIKLFGLVGAAAVVLLANFIGLCLQVVWMNRLSSLRFKEYVAGWVPGISLAIVTLAPQILLRTFCGEMLILNIGIGSLMCLVAYIVGLFWLGHYGKTLHICLEKVV
jgi:PST family polysaccharide transporter/lipopolysaccharide exporter